MTLYFKVLVCEKKKTASQIKIIIVGFVNEYMSIFSILGRYEGYIGLKIAVLFDFAITLRLIKGCISSVLGIHYFSKISFDIKMFCFSVSANQIVEI